jgi:large subunit ribosomal protein L16
MLFIPKNSKFKKQQKKNTFNKINNNLTFNFNDSSVYLKALSFGRVTSKQLNSIRQTINKVIKKVGKIRFNVFPHTPISKKPKEIRMGKGKGNIDHWISKIKTGQIICEIKTDSSSKAVKALKLASFRFPLKTKIILN